MHHLRKAPTALSSARRLHLLPALVRLNARLASTTSTGTELQVTDPLDLYRGMVALGKVKYDPDQVRALVQMRKLHAELLDYQPPIRLLTLLEALRPTSELEGSAATVPEWPFKRSFMSSLGTELLPSEAAERQEIVEMSEKSRSKALVKVLKGEQGLDALTTPKGFLLTGPPGTGKSLLMDIFFQSLPIPHKVRYHYHHFLLSIYSKVHEALEIQRLENEMEEKAMNLASGENGDEGYPWSRREEMKALAITKGWRSVFAGGRSANDPDLNTKDFVLAAIARDLIKTHGWLLAFDEVQLVDIAGAGLINRVLSWYWRLGGVVVGTSNRVPEDLYNSGVQRASVDSFLTALATRSPVIELGTELDYRRVQRGADLGSESNRPPGEFGEVAAWQRWGSDARGWYVRGQEHEFEEATKRIVGEELGRKETLRVYGRNLVVPWVVGGVARFSFKELCEDALGPADFITLGSTYHTIIITDVPILLLNAKNQARRLITLLDSLYETKTRLLVYAETGIDTLFFPDAVKGSSFSEKRYDPTAPDDIVTYVGPNHPFSAERIYESDSTSMPGHSALRHAVDPSGEIGDALMDMDQPVPVNLSHAVDPAGEIGDSLTQEMVGDLIQDLEAPYRPNISAYDASADVYNKDEARTEPVRKSIPQVQKRAAPHPSASTPAFASLAIFSGKYCFPTSTRSCFALTSFVNFALYTGEEERFAFSRAVSRVHEMSSSEFLRSAQWTPLDPSMRTWERSIAPVVRKSAARPSRDAMGAALPLSDDKLSGVLAPSDMRLKYPSGMPRYPQEIDVREQVKGKKASVLDMDDPKREVQSKPIKTEHVWGVREDWGKGAGKWGKGASAFDEEKK